MKEDRFFWMSYSTREKIAFFTAVALWAVWAGLSLWYWIQGERILFSWDTVTTLKEKAVQTPAMYLDTLSFSATTPLWYVTEHYVPAAFRVNVFAYYLFLGSLVVGVSLIMSGLCRLRGVWFLVGAVLLGGVLASFRLESVFLTSKNWPFLVVFALMGGYYYWNNGYARKVDAAFTFMGWALVWAAVLAALAWVSTINVPLLSMATYGLVAALMLTFLFIFLTAHELLAGLYRMVSGTSQKGKNSLPQMLVVTAVFLVNAVLIYLENARRIAPSAFVVSPLILFLANTLVGLWGFRHLSEQRGWFTFRGVGLWVYLGLAVVAVGTVGLVYGTYNTPLMELLEDYISIAILGAGLCYFVHIALNFWPMIKAGLPFYKVIYKPPFTPLLLARVAALFVMFFLFSMKNRYSFFQLQAGTSNAIADFYANEGDFRSAEVYFKSGAQYDLYNKRSNLCLASLADQAGDMVSATWYYRQAGTKYPNAHAAIGLSSALEQQEMYFEALFSLKEGIQFLPDEHRLYTNLARLQQQTGGIDSALVHVDKAMQLCPRCGPENVNFLAFWIDHGRNEKLTEMLALSQENASYSYRANRSAIDRLLGEETAFEVLEVAPDSSLDMGRAAYLLNAMSNARTVNKTPINARQISVFQERNQALAEQLQWAAAHQTYYREDKVEGLRRLAYMAASPSKLAPLYHQNLGMWLMREGAFTASVKQLQKARDSSSVYLLENAQIKAEIDSRLQQQAKELLEGLTLENRTEKKNKGALNPYFLEAFAEFLSKKGLHLEAYNALFYAMEFVPDSPVLLKAYIEKALDLSMFEYAEDAMVQARTVMTNQEFWELEDRVTKAREAARSFQ